MLAVKWLGIFSFLLAICDGIDPTQTPKRKYLYVSVYNSFVFKPEVAGISIINKVVLYRGL